MASGPADAKGLLLSAIQDPDPVIFEPKMMYVACNIWLNNAGKRMSDVVQKLTKSIISVWSSAWSHDRTVS